MKGKVALNCLLGLLIAWTETTLSEIPCDENEWHIRYLTKLYESVNLTSPNFTTSIYPYNKTCYWKVLVEAGNIHSATLKVAFKYFQLEYSPHCNNESLTFYDGKSLNSDKQSVGTFCGTTHPEVLYLSNPEITFKFRPSEGGHYRGFSLNIVAVPEDQANDVCRYSSSWRASSYGDTGTIFSPNYPAKSPPGISCHWDIIVREGRIRLTFEDFQLSSNNDSSCTGENFVQVTDSKYLGLLLLKNCILKTPAFVESIYPRLWVTFNTRNGVPHRGFKAHYETIPFTSDVECVSGNPNNLNLTLDGSSGTFHGPQYIPAPVPSSPTCIWIITVPDGKVVELRFENDNFNYRNDYIEILDGRYGSSELIGKKTEIWRRKPEGIRSSGRYLRIEYTSTGYGFEGKPTFSAHFEAVDKPKTGLIVGTVFGSLGILCGFAVALYILKRKKSRQTATNRSDQDSYPDQTDQSRQSVPEHVSQHPSTNWLPYSQTFDVTAETHYPKFPVDLPRPLPEEPPPPYSAVRDPPPPYPGVAEDT